MSIIEAILLGIIQGLTEFLPVSSSGHLELGKALLGIELEENLSFTVVVHFATVLSTITVFIKEINELIKGFFKFRWNDDMRYVMKLLLSAIPVLFVGLFFENEVAALFEGNLFIVGGALLLTALLLALTNMIGKIQTRRIPFSDAFIMGVAQAVAVIPGISRSGSTIATGLLLKNKREDVARFSFLMVLIPIIGATLLKIMDWADTGMSGINPMTLVAGFLAAYISGFLACKWMIGIVKKGKLIWFAAYCAVIGLIAILTSF
ncbi:MAG TPA: undecaprenyl-diphosphate phosphatase [Bacteroidales bacterium]|nr:undecaprenyl-diphosphate phosphatase [Bacteroidales bacterium]